jgi:hypothetical protein
MKVGLYSGLRAVHSRIGYGSDVEVLESSRLRLPLFSGPQHPPSPGPTRRPESLGLEQHPERGIDRAQQAVAEIRLLARLHGVNIRGPKYVNAREPPHKR